NWNDRLTLAQDYRLVAHQLWSNGDPRGARDPIARAIAISEALNSEQPDNSKILYELGFDHEVSGRIGFPGDRSEDHRGRSARTGRGPDITATEIGLDGSTIV